jgi:molybdopterin/thiamine biosynthesis adenylyltransferase
VTSTPTPTPAAIERGVRGLQSVTGCVVEEGPVFHVDAKLWAIKFSLKRDAESHVIGRSTRWFALVGERYPFSEIAIHPAAEGGITVTFPHQSRNTPSRERRNWRGGKLCLDSPFGGERRLSLVRDPVGDSESRLRWHIERALVWLNHAANEQLLAMGDPFELPAHSHASSRAWLQQRVVHDETTLTFDAWNGRQCSHGFVELGLASEISNMIGVVRFEDENHSAIRGWAGRELEKCKDISGFWWLWPKPVVHSPWQAPETWGELRCIAKEMAIDADNMLRWLVKSLRGAKTSNILLVGYPIPQRVGAPASEVHWDALLLPSVGAEDGKPPDGFRPNALGWWQRDRFETFADKVALQYLHTENWSPERLQARGRLPSSVRDLRIVLIGVGALGSILGEMLVRAGVRDITLVDGELLSAGNVCRHVATLLDVGKRKVQIVAQRLRQISPAVRVIEVKEELHAAAQAVHAQFDEYDVIIDCTSSDDALSLLASAWWSIPRVFASFSLGYGGKRLFSFGVNGHQLPLEEFLGSVRPWLDHEAQSWGDSEEVLEGAGCWSPLFPARYDDVVLAAATCVKELETLVDKRPLTPRLRVFAQSCSGDGFQRKLSTRMRQCFS